MFEYRGGMTVSVGEEEEEEEGMMMRGGKKDEDGVKEKEGGAKKEEGGVEKEEGGAKKEEDGVKKEEEGGNKEEMGGAKEEEGGAIIKEGGVNDEEGGAKEERGALKEGIIVRNFVIKMDEVCCIYVAYVSHDHDYICPYAGGDLCPDVAPGGMVSGGLVQLHTWGHRQVTAALEGNRLQPYSGSHSNRVGSPIVIPMATG